MELVSGPVAERWEVHQVLSGAALAAASEGLFVIVHSGFRDKEFLCGENTQRINKRVQEYIAGLLFSICCFQHLFVCGFMWINETTRLRSDDRRAILWPDTTV
jgi:hypothetical protein